MALSIWSAWCWTAAAAMLTVPSGPLSLPAAVAGRLGREAASRCYSGQGVVTGGKSGLQASGGKGFTKDFCSAAFVTRC